MNIARTIAKTVIPTNTTDGAGVKLKRSIGSNKVSYFDPFLLLDEFKSDESDEYINGFPDHPHRGFETVTYMLKGSVEHRDHGGNQGLLNSGDVQWMTAGRGIIHSEMPKQEEGLLWGFQLWVNLPSKDKMMEPRYQDIPSREIPLIRDENVTVKVIAGEYKGTVGPVRDIVTEPTYLDVNLEAGAIFEIEIPRDHNIFAYVYDGAAIIDNQDASASKLILFENDGDRVQVRGGVEPSNFLIVSGKPIGEKIARYGPFVMNTPEEIMQAFDDFQNGRLQ